MKTSSKGTGVVVFIAMDPPVTTALTAFASVEGKASNTMTTSARKIRLPSFRYSQSMLKHRDNFLQSRMGQLNACRMLSIRAPMSEPYSRGSRSKLTCHTLLFDDSDYLWSFPDKLGNQHCCYLSSLQTDVPSVGEHEQGKHGKHCYDNARGCHCTLPISYQMSR